MKNDSTQADICRIVRATMPLWEHLPQPMQDEMRIAIENYLSGVFDAGAGFYFFEVGNLWPQVQAALDNIKFDRCRCRIFREWTDMLGPLEGNEKGGADSLLKLSVMRFSGRMSRTSPMMRNSRNYGKKPM